MKNFKEIAEKCLAGELKGIFKNRKGDSISSEALCRYSSKTYPYSYYYSHWACVTRHGDFFKSGKFSEYDIIDFIPDNMQKKIEIDIPEGKVPVMEQTENGVVITWEDPVITYNLLYQSIYQNDKAISSVRNTVVNETNTRFLVKVNVLRKLTNIRNYFGKPTDDEGYGIFYHEHYKKFYVDVVGPFSPVHVCFSTKEHAEQAIKMLGDELKYLFEPW